MKILKRKPSKICPSCEKRFFRGGRQLSKWNKQIYCSFSCNVKRLKRKVDILQHIKNNSLLSSSGCLEWQLNKVWGYGQTIYLGKTCRVHRLIWTLEKGEIPKGLFVCHHCDNRKCVNVEHLFLGTAKDNVRDMINKGRKSIIRILNHDLIIKLAKNEFYTYKEIAKQCNCGRGSVARIAIKNGIRRVQIKGVKND